VRAKWILIGVSLISVMLSGTASADTARFNDPNDTPGRLDVKAVRHGHDGARLVHSAYTYRRWGSRALSDDESYIGFYLDAGTSRTRADRFVWIRHKPGRGLYARIFRPGVHANGERLGKVRVSRPGRRSVRIYLRRSQLSSGILNGYRWRVTTSYEKSTTGGACGDDGQFSSFPTGRCIDNVPGLQQEGFRHRL